MSSQDIRNNALVHSILVRNYLNTQRMEHIVVGETATISGVVELQREAHFKDKKAAESTVMRTLEKVEREIKKLPNIEFVSFHLDNYARQGRRWVCTSAEAAPRERRIISSGEEKRVKL